MKLALYIQKKSIKVYLYAFLLLSLIFLYELGTHRIRPTHVVGFVLFGIILIISYILYRKTYMNSLLIYLGAKSFNLLVSVILAPLLGGPFLIFYVFFAILCLLEIDILVYSNKDQLRNVGVLIGGIFLIGGVVYFVNKNVLSTPLFSVITVVMFVYSYYIIIDLMRNDTYNKLDLQTQLFKEAAKTNEELRLSQNKFKKIHEDVAKQKNDLEEANKRLNRMTAEIYTQNELLRYISQVLDIKELVDMVSDAILGTIGVDTCSLIVYDELRNKNLYSIKSNHSGNHKEELEESVQKGYLQKYFESGKIHLNNRVISSKYPFINKRPVGSLAVIPLLKEDKTYGLIIAEHSNKDMFTESNIAFFNGIATQITIAVNNAKLYATMEDMAKKDGLTGIYNRKYLQEQLKAIIVKADKTKESVTMALFDIDKFKSINDRFGHSTGDEAIKLVASTALEIAKEYDGMVSRYGGEEFVLLLPERTTKEAMPIVEKLHENIKNIELVYENIPVKVNVSIGVTSYPELADNSNELLSRADNAMYYAKENGRGRIVLDSKDIEKVI